MSKQKNEGTPIARTVAIFLKHWLPEVRQRSKHTVRSYQGMFKSLHAYMDDQYGLAPISITFESLDDKALTGFLHWLSECQGLQSSSVNTRLGALKSFACYVQITNPAEALFCINVDNLQFKKTIDGAVKHMSVEAIGSLFDLASQTSLRDLAILRTLYASGAREAEFLQLIPRDVRFNKDATASIGLVGKGSKSRIVKIDSCSASILKLHIQQNVSCSENPLFAGRDSDKALSASGLIYVVNKYAQMLHRINPMCIPESIHPHMFRHSIATHMLKAGVDLESIRLFLGHASIATTMMYAKSDPSAVSEAVFIVEKDLIKPVAIPIEAKKDELDDWLAKEY